MWLSFDPLDVWFFRDGRPFDAGEAHRGRSRFPVPPETALGAVRALLLHTAFARQGVSGLTLANYNRWLTARPRLDPMDYDDGITDPAVQRQFRDAADRFGWGELPGRDIALRGPFVVAPEGVDTARSGQPTHRLLLVAPRDLLGTDSTPKRLLRLEPLADVASDVLREADWKPMIANASPEATDKGAASMRLMPLVSAGGSGEELSGIGWINLESLCSYLTGFDHFAEEAVPVDIETRSGIALEASGKTREGHLYQIEVIRPRTAASGEQTRLLVKVETDEPTPSDQWMPLGGEGRLAHVVTLSPLDGLVTAMDDLLSPTSHLADEIRDVAAETGWVRLILLQPAIFARGWLPDAVDATTGELTVDGHTFQLRSAAVDKPSAISGWDMRRREPKPLRRAAPAGSVYYFQHIGDSAQRAEAMQAFIARYHGSADLCANTAARRSGYGLTVAGVCEPMIPG